MSKNLQNRVEQMKNRIKHKVRVAAAALLATTGGLVSQANAENVQRDDHQPTPWGQVDQQTTYTVDEVKEIAHKMYLNSIDNFVDNYLRESLENIPEIRKARRKGSETSGEVRAIKEKLGIAIPKNIQGQHCSFGGTNWLFQFTPQFLIDSCYNLYTNPAYPPAIFADSKKITKKYSNDYNNLFLDGKTNIYKKIQEYNQKNNLNNEKKVFFCEETNKKGTEHHFTVIVFDGKDYFRISFNSADIQNIKEYNYAQNTIGKVFDFTRMLDKYIDWEIAQTAKNNNGILSQGSVDSLFSKLSQMLSSDTYQVNPEKYSEQLAELEQQKNNPFQNMHLTIEKVPQKEFTLLTLNDSSIKNQQTVIKQQTPYKPKGMKYPTNTNNLAILRSSKSEIRNS